MGDIVDANKVPGPVAPAGSEGTATASVDRKIAWVSLGLAILGILLTIYVYRQQTVIRDPVFAVEPSRAEIISRDRINIAPIRVTHVDGTPIEGDIYAAQFYFWNAGKEAISHDDVLTPLTITMEDTSARLLDYRVLTATRSVVAPRLRIPPIDTPTVFPTLLLEFRILEKDDGISGQLIYQGPRAVPVTIVGDIEGVRGGIRTAARGPASERAVSVLWLIGGLFAVVVLGAVLIIRKSGLRVNVKPALGLASRAGGWIFQVLVVVILILLLVNFVPQLVGLPSERVLIDQLPEMLRTF
jgi:hypothetical protein